MSDKFKNKYKINSARLKNYDYSQNGMYFVTICTKDKKDYFGKIEGENMILSDIGKVADEFWREIPKHFSFANLDEYQIMPDHLHGIIEILPYVRRDEAVPRLYNGSYPKMSKISPKAGSLPSIIGAFKSIVTKTIHKQFPEINFQWQLSFYEHIIRKRESLNKVREYIINNPKMWGKDGCENIFLK